MPPVSFQAAVISLNNSSSLSIYKIKQIMSRSIQDAKLRYRKDRLPIKR